MNTETVNREKLYRDVKTVLADADELLRATAADTSERVKALRPKLEESLRSTKSRLKDAEEALLEKTRAAAEATDRFAHENPWQTAGIAAAVGVLLGLMLNRRD